MRLADLPDLMTVPEASAALRVSKNTGYELAHVWLATGGEAGLPVVPVGRSLRVPKAALLKLLDPEQPPRLRLEPHETGSIRRVERRRPA